jgi:4-diphosphocytidyl-2-C-methyl-D-erythritol kinase
VADAITVRAHGKVNLALAVAPPEPPQAPRAGWHRIASWMAPIELADEVTVEAGARGGSRLEVSWAADAPLHAGERADWPAEKDLAWRALKLLEDETGRELLVAITIRKRVPAAAGLGGGSSDAAAVLQLLDELFELGLGPGRLRALGARLGSDVAFFIDEDVRRPARAALVTGFGDRIERAPMPAVALVLIAPEFGCSTPAVYRAFDELGPGEFLDEASSALVAEPVEALAAGGRCLFNDLAEAAERVAPRLAALRAAARNACGAPVHITGSGSAMFIVCEPAGAEALAERLGPVVAPGVALATAIAAGGAA